MADSARLSFLPGLLILAIGCIVLFAFARMETRTGGRLDQIIRDGALIFAGIAILLILAVLYAGGRSLAKETQRWMKDSLVAQVRILNRHDSGVYDDGHRYHSYGCRLDLEMCADQRAYSPGSTWVEVAVSQSVFDKLAGRDMVRIHYYRYTPLEFLIEGED